MIIGHDTLVFSAVYHVCIGKHKAGRCRSHDAGQVAVAQRDTALTIFKKPPIHQPLITQLLAASLSTEENGGA
jgi:hypothetical protein